MKTEPCLPKAEVSRHKGNTFLLITLWNSLPILKLTPLCWIIVVRLSKESRSKIAHKIKRVFKRNNEIAVSILYVNLNLSRLLNKVKLPFVFVSWVLEYGE